MANNEIHYYSKPREDEKGYFVLTEECSAAATYNSKGPAFTINTPYRIYYCYAETDYEVTTWVAAINSTINKIKGITDDVDGNGKNEPNKSQKEPSSSKAKSIHYPPYIPTIVNLQVDPKNDVPPLVKSIPPESVVLSSITPSIAAEIQALISL